MKWTKAKIKQAKTLWALKKSAQFIADDIGAVSRSAVMGKLDRLGLLGHRRIRSMRKPTVVRLPKITAPGLVAPVVVLNPEDFKCGINQLKHDTCHWMRDDSLYCGMPVRVGAPYCADHCKLAYQPVRERKVKQYTEAQ